ncbi:MAG: sugar kinase [Spirochaetes bacterium]|nr:sugar kinase [Spirochaetota bacterium]MBN2771296.1 sugar kinase [Spirochaetota bacterium]
MEPLSENKIVIITRKTRLDDLIARFNSVSQAKFYVEHLGADFSDYEKEHSDYILAVRQASELLSAIGRIHVLDREYLTNYIFGPNDVVVAIGQDGMVANTLKYLSGQSLLGVNPSPDRWDGVLLPFYVKDLPLVIPEVIRGQRGHREVTIAAARLNDNQELLAVNDFFIGQKSHVSSRYQIEYAGFTEAHSSSGIIVSTGLGSTGWFKSILTGAQGVVGKISGNDFTIESNDDFSWDSEYLYYSVREPFPSNNTGTELVFGKITKQQPLKITSQMSENGVIFSDGIEKDFLEFNSGMEAVIGLSGKKGLLVV